MRSTRRRVAAAVGAVALLASITYANAANLSLAAVPVIGAAVNHPCQGTATATAATGSGATYSAASVTLPAGCAGRSLTMRMTSGSTTLTGTAQVTASNVAVVSFAPTTYNATSTWTIVAVVGGWNLPTAWSFTLPAIWCTVVDSTTATCTATVTLFHGSKPGGGEYDYYDVEVKTSSTTAVEWEVGFNLAHQFYGGAPETLGNSTLDGYNDGGANWTGDQADVDLVSQCSEYPGQLRVRGEYHSATWNPNYEDVRNNRPRRFSLVLNYQSGTYDDLVDANCSP